MNQSFIYESVFLNDLVEWITDSLTHKDSHSLPPTGVFIKPT